MLPRGLSVSGWDIGGAHLKAALTDAQGRIHTCSQLPCPLWQGLEKLEHAFTSMQAQLGSTGSLAAVTMTGELADLFNNRNEGVLGILDCVCQYFGSKIPVYVFAEGKGFIALEEAKGYSPEVASANYLATSQLAARYWSQGLVMDVGSTTTDIIPCDAGHPCPQGKNDRERLIEGELVYSGVTRTSLMALAPQAPLGGRWVRLAAEHFATTADIYRLLGYLAAEADYYPSADNRSKHPADCAQRLARMVGSDSHYGPLSTWKKLARYFAERQSQQLTEASLQVLSRIDLAPEAPFIGAGIGRFLVAECARRLQRPYVDFSQALVSHPQALSASADHASAAALARLAWEQFGESLV
jgi:(4-(4-[2-(gamma-L-glutamylamino)ethyl]phenoxymethyl)furan-2-yl)methanamine synthase